MILIAAVIVLAATVQDPCARAAQLVADAEAAGKDGRDVARQLSLSDEAIRLCPTLARAHNHRGDALENLGRPDEAVKAYAEAVRLDPSWALPRFGLGDVFYAQKDAQQALYWYRAGLDLEPGDPLASQRVRELTTHDPPGLISSRSIRKVLETPRGLGVVASLRFDETLIPFEFDSARLLPGASAQVGEIGQALWGLLGTTRSIGVVASTGPVLAVIVGHADRRGTDEYNLDLSRRRTEAVVAALERTHGIPRSRLRVESYGRSRPLCADDTEVCHQRNRRVEIEPAR